MGDEGPVGVLLVLIGIIALIVYLIYKCVSWLFTDDRSVSGSSFCRSEAFESARRSYLLDLHGMSVSSAVDAVKSHIKNNKAAGSRSVKVITGQGLHSPWGQPRIRPAVIGYLNSRGCRYDDSDPGHLTIYL